MSIWFLFPFIWMGESELVLVNQCVSCGDVPVTVFYSGTEVFRGRLKEIDFSGTRIHFKDNTTQKTMKVVIGSKTKAIKGSPKTNCWIIEIVGEGKVEDMGIFDFETCPLMD